MNITLIKATEKDAKILHNLKLKSFLPLLKIYKDFESNPATEPLIKIIDQLKQTTTDYYIIKYNDSLIGGIRIVKSTKNNFRISPIFLIPEYQNIGIGQKVFTMIENMYDNVDSWQLETILEEKNLCYLYEKIAYVKTGKYKVIKDGFTIVFYEKKIKR